MTITTISTIVVRTARYSLFIFAMLLLQGCPYESPFPISKKEILFPAEYLGTWYEKDGNEGILDYKKFVFRRKSDTTIYLDNMELNDNDKWETTTYQCHISYVGDSRFINVKTTNDIGEGIYYLYSVEMDSDQMLVRGMTTNVIKDFENADSLYQYIEKYKHLDFFYSQEEALTLVQWGDH